MEPHFDEQGWVLPQGPTLESVLLNLARCSCTGKTVWSREVGNADMTGFLCLPGFLQMKTRQHCGSKKELEIVSIFPCDYGLHLILFSVPITKIVEAA